MRNKTTSTTTSTSSTPWWLPFAGLAIMAGGWLVQYGMERAEHKAMEAKVRKLEAMQDVTNFINYSEHHQYWENLLSAQKTQ